MKTFRTAGLLMAAASGVLSMVMLVGQAAADAAYPSEGSSIAVVSQVASDLDKSQLPGNQALQAATCRATGPFESAAVPSVPACEVLGSGRSSAHHASQRRMVVIRVLDPP